MNLTSLVDFEAATPQIAQLLADAREKQDREMVAAFTDEELVALDGVGTEHVAPMLWLDNQPAENREFAAGVALRGLVARGLVAKLDEHQEEGKTVLSMPDEVMAVLAMRRTASSIIVAERQTNAGKHARVVYVHSTLGVLEENVNTGGLHSFSVCPEDMALDDLAVMSDPDGVAGEHDGDEQTLTLAEFSQGGEVPASLENALAVTVLASVTEPTEQGGEPDQDRLTVYCFEDHVKVAHQSPTTTDALVIRRVGGSSLREAVRAVATPGGRGHGSARGGNAQ